MREQELKEKVMALRFFATIAAALATGLLLGSPVISQPTAGDQSGMGINGRINEAISLVTTSKLSCSEKYPAKRLKPKKGKPAIFMEKAFPHATDGQCYSCPRGLKPSTAHIHSRTACRLNAHISYRSASKGERVGFLKNCPKKHINDRATGQCWACHRGYKRTAFGITSDKACSRRFKTRVSRAYLRGPDG